MVIVGPTAHFDVCSCGNNDVNIASDGVSVDLNIRRQTLDVGQVDCDVSKY